MPGESVPRWDRIISIGECMVEMAPRAGGGYTLSFAGDTFNTAWYLRRSCDPATAVEYLTAVGCDAISDRMVAFMDRAGINTALVGRRTDATVGLYLVDLDEGERHFAYWRAQSAARRLDEELGGLGQGDHRTLIYFSGITLAILSDEGRERLLSHLSSARAQGSVVAFDPNIRPHLWEDEHTLRRWITRAAEHADFAFPSADDEVSAFDDAGPQTTAERYRRAGVRHVIVKDGPRTVLYAGPQGRRAEAMPDPVEPVDTTAAGDAFNAGLLAALNRNAGLDDALRAGCDLSRHVVLGRGALVNI